MLSSDTAEGPRGHTTFLGVGARMAATVFTVTTWTTRRAVETGRTHILRRNSTSPGIVIGMRLLSIRRRTAVAIVACEGIVRVWLTQVGGRLAVGTNTVWWMLIDVGGRIVRWVWVVGLGIYGVLWRRREVQVAWVVVMRLLVACSLGARRQVSVARGRWAVCLTIAVEIASIIIYEGS